MQNLKLHKSNISKFARWVWCFFSEYWELFLCWIYAKSMLGKFYFWPKFWCFTNISIFHTV